MIGSSVNLINVAWERAWYKLLPQSHSPGGELLPLHHVAEGDGVDGIKGAIGSSSDSVSPPILVVCRSVLCILFFSVTPRKIVWGVLFIVGFRSGWVRRVKVCIDWMHEGGDGPHHTIQKWARMVPPLFLLVVFPVDYFFSRFSIFWKNDVAKRLGPFDILKVCESQKYTKTRKSALQC
jgi:hypothetical protein